MLERAGDIVGGLRRDRATRAAQAEFPADRAASRWDLRIAVALGLLLPGLSLASLTLLDWGPHPTIVGAPVFPSGVIDPSAPRQGDTAVSPASEEESLYTPPKAAPVAAKAATARAHELDGAPRWLASFVNNMRESLSGERRSAPDSLPEPGGHR